MIFLIFARESFVLNSAIDQEFIVKQTFLNEFLLKPSDLDIH